MTTAPENIEFIETAPYETGFRAHFETQVKPKLQILENLRLEKLKEYQKRIKTCIPLCIIAEVILLSLFGFFHDSLVVDSDLRAIGFLISIPIGFAWFYVNTPKQQYRKSNKESILPEVLGFYGTLTFQCEGVYPKEILYKSQVFEKFDNQKSEDFIGGQLDNLGFDLAEVELTRREGKQTITVFKGEIVTFEMNKNFSGQTVILPDDGKEGGFWDAISGFTKSHANLQRVKLEDPIFEQHFQVFSSDQVEARYLLTTAFMERLLKLKEFHQTPKIRCSFFDNKVLFAITNYRNLFEPCGINESALSTDDIHKFFAEMNQYRETIKILKLNLKIGM